MGNQMEYGLIDMRTDRRVKKELTRMGNQMEYGLIGMRTDRRVKKELTKVGNGLILLVNGNRI